MLFPRPIPEYPLPPKNSLALDRKLVGDPGPTYNVGLEGVRVFPLPLVRRGLLVPIPVLSGLLRDSHSND